MKVDIKIDPGLSEPFAEIHTSEITPMIQQLTNVLSGSQTKTFTGMKDKKIYLLNQADIICFFSEGQSIYAKTFDGSYIVKSRLYELEEALRGSSFVRISSSVIANVDKISCLEMHLNGTMSVRFKNGGVEYASRRYVGKLKDFVGL